MCCESVKASSNVVFSQYISSRIVVLGISRQIAKIVRLTLSIIFRSALLCIRQVTSALEEELKMCLLPAYHHVLIVFLAIAIVLLCKSTLSTIVTQKAWKAESKKGDGAH